MILHSNRYEVSSSLILPSSGSVAFVGLADSNAEFIREHYECSQPGYLVELIEGCTYSGGATVTAQNLVRASSFTAKMQVIAGATISGGTVIRTTGTPAGDSPQARISSSGELVDPWVLKDGVTYAIRITNLESVSKDMIVQLGWVEYELL